MKPATTPMITNLATLDQFNIAELVTFTLADGTILRFTTAQSDITLSGNLFSSAAPFVSVEGLKQRLGLEVDVITVTLTAAVTNLVESQPYLQAILTGLFDKAHVQVERAFMPTFGDVSAGSVILFAGNVADITECDRIHAVLEVRSRLQLLNKPAPFRIYQPSCPWILYGPGCGLSQAAFAVAGAVVGTGLPLLFNTNLSQPDGDFDQGIIKFTSGANNGIQRGVRSYLNASGQILLYIPLPFAPAGGDAFNIFPGCDKTSSRCTSRFNNLINFGGEEFVPIPETAV